MNVNRDKNQHEIPELNQKKNFLGKWASFFIERFRVTFLIILAILVWGSYQTKTLQREAQPKVVLPMAIVSTSYVGASPDEVETLVTDKIEEKLEELDDVNEMSSSSGFGYSSIFIEFESGVDINEKIRDMREKLSNIERSLPEDVSTPVISDIKTGNGPVLVFSVSGETDTLLLQNIAKNIQNEIEKVKGVSEAGIIGDMEREISIIVNPQKLHTYGITQTDIKNAITQSNVNFPGGEVELNNKIYSIRTVGRFDRVRELENIIIKTSAQGQVYLKDIADIKDGYEEKDIFISKFHITVDGQRVTKNAVMVAVNKKESADVLKVKQDVMKRLESISSKFIPENISIDLVSDQSEYVEDILGGVTNNAFAGLLLVIVVLFIFIGFRESIIVSIVIPLSLLMAFGLLKVAGHTINNITMFSMILAVGMLVDNAIVIMENVDRLRFKGLSAKVAAEVGTNQIAPAVFASTLTTLAAFFPIALTSGIMGDFIKPIPITVIFALGSSFLMAITVTPSICSLFLKNHRSNDTSERRPVKNTLKIIFSVLLVFILALFAFSNFEKQGLERFGLLSIIGGILFATGMFIKVSRSKRHHEHGIIVKKYSHLLNWIIQKRLRKFIILGFVGLAFIFSVALIPSGLLKVEMFGSTDFPYLFVNINTPPGTVIEETRDIVNKVEKRLLKIDEIESFVSYAGSHGVSIWSESGVSFDEDGIPNAASINIDLIDEKFREKTSMEIAEDLRNMVKDIPGAEIKVRELENGPPTQSPIYIRVKGDNLKQIETVSNDFKDILNSIKGVRDIGTSQKTGRNILQIKVDRQKARRLGLDDMTVAFGIRNAINGLEATTFRQNQDEIDVIIKTAQHKLNNINDLENSYFYNRMGDAISFSQIASFIETDSIQSIYHEDGKRLIAVSANIEEGINPKVKTPMDAEKIFKEKLKQYPMPEDITVEFGGESEAMGDSFGDMMANMVIAAILVFIILAVQFNSLSQPLIILFTVPMALIGVMNGLLITGNTFGFVAFVGVVALVGIAVNDAIVLVDYINYLRKNGYSMNEAIIETGMTRFIPVMATTITTAGGILPITIRDKFLAPMGVALIAGLCMATVLTLVVIPTIYSLFEGFKIYRKEKKTRKMNSVEINV